jgi:copper homeostasis protein
VTPVVTGCFYAALMGVLLEVAVAHERDVAGAQEGGADRLHLSASGGLSPEPAVVSGICRETDLPVHVVLRLNETWTTTGGELTRLVGLGEDFLACGARGVAFGFLDADLEIDSEVCRHLAGALPHVPWTFHDALDDALDTRRSWRRLLHLPGLVNVRSAGSARGMGEGYEELLATSESDPAIAALLMPGGGLLAEHVPWLVRTGVRAFHLGPQVRPGASFKAYVDADLTRSWRLLVDSALERI